MNAESIKCVVVGNSNVGKTSLLDKMLNGKITTTFSTIGVECRTIIIPGMNVLKVRFWDTAGEERFNAVSKVYFRGVDCAIACFSALDEESMHEVKRWVRDIRSEHQHVSRKQRKQIEEHLFCQGRGYSKIPDDDDDEEGGYAIPILLVVTKCDDGTPSKVYEDASMLARELHVQGPVFTSALRMDQEELQEITKPFFRVVHRQVAPRTTRDTVELSKPTSRSSWNHCCRML